MKSCALTGHRPKSFPWRYDETAHDCVLLKEVLTAQITALIGSGVTGQLSGMAEGVDLWTAEIVLALREKNPAIKLHCILPCKEQTDNWTALSRDRYDSILDRADSIVYVSRSYHKDCMLERNRFLVDHSAMLLAVYNGSRRSGTGATINYARKLDREIIVIDPITRGICRESANT